jgi:antitoxin component of MazEF toxin-antitoxin module
MSDVNPDYVGSRKMSKSGDSTVVTLPKRDLRQIGIDVEELEGDYLKCRVEDGEFIVDLPIDD